MFHLDNNSGVSAMPPVGTVQSSAPRWFTEGGGGTPASYPGADWYNIIQAELLNFLSAYGIAPDKADLSQLRKAIEAAIKDKATAKSPLLTAIAALVTSADKMPYFNGKDTVAMTALTAFAREVLAQTDAAGVLSKLHLEETVKLAKNALPLSGGRLTGPVSLVNGNGKRLQIETAGNPTSNIFVVLTGTDERPCLIEFKDETSYHFFSQRNPDGTITFQTAGKMIPLDYSNFDAKYQAKGNYAVKGDSYTKEETNLKFENEKISGVGPFSFLDKTSGLILKAAGVTFATEGDRVTFPEAFPNVCRAVVLTLNGSAGETTRNIVATNVSRTGFSIARGSNEAGVFWMAVGV
ncbi:hypothetical protein HU31_003534 [Salmonella enterica subsp. enterica serovar Apapa]|nr:hypothetical protein [Salmonella enterica subsp. enterica serovar Apapa]